jgi:Bacterial Ig-like domain (group 3)/FG-GAP-like repeat
MGLSVGRISIADINGDGNPDVMIADCCSLTFTTIVRGNGDFTFSANYALAVGTQSVAVAFADLNNDGRPDILIADDSHDLIVSLNRYAVLAGSPIATLTALTVSPNPAVLGQTVTITAQVTATGATPGGTVTFLDGTTTLGTGTLVSGQASYTGSLAAGVHAITASYGGDTTYAASVSTVDNLTIGSAPTLAATTTQLTGSPTTASSGTTINFKASVSETAGTATPTGAVTFYDGPPLLEMRLSLPVSPLSLPRA